MANALYTKAKEGILAGDIRWTTDNVRVMLVNATSYTVNASTDQYLSDIPSGARVAQSSVLTGRTATNGAADANDVTIDAIVGVDVDAMVLFVDTGTPSSSRLIAYIDDPTAFTFSPDGGGAQISWPAGGIFSW